MGLLCLFIQSGCDRGGEDRVVDTGVSLDEAELMQFVHKKDAQVIRFGFDLRSSPQEDARQYLPFLDYLEQKTGYRFELRFTPADRDIIDELGSGEVQLAAVGASSYLKAREKYGVVILVRGLNKQARAEYQSTIVVRPDASIKRLQDLRGKRIAFGDINSTQGHLIPRIIFAQKGMQLDQFARYVYTGSHRNCVKAVITGLADACGMQDTMAKDMEAQGDIRILHVSRYFPSSGIAVNRNVKAEVQEKIRQALLEFDPVKRNRIGLYSWDKTEMPLGFAVAGDADYQDLRNWLLRLGLLETGQADTAESGT
jgi:phosphonate transport system substrate-binding protein